MLTIRREQMRLLGEEARHAFETEVLRELCRSSPHACAAAGDGAVRKAVAAGFAHARRHGFESRGATRLYVQLSFALGVGFDTDPLHAWAGRVLQGDGPVLFRAHRLRAEATNRLGGSPFGAAPEPVLTRARCLLEQPRPVDRDEAALAGRCAWLDPTLAQRLGTAGMVALARGARAEARAWYIAPAHAALVLALQLLLGHRCRDDPLHPWIAEALAGPPDRLPLRALQWLEQRWPTPDAAP